MSIFWSLLNRQIYIKCCVTILESGKVKMHIIFFSIKLFRTNCLGCIMYMACSHTLSKYVGRVWSINSMFLTEKQHPFPWCGCGSWLPCSTSIRQKQALFSWCEIFKITWKIPLEKYLMKKEQLYEMINEFMLNRTKCKNLLNIEEQSLKNTSKIKNKKTNKSV